MDTTLLKGLRALEALAVSCKSRALSDLAAELGLPKSNMHRVLQTLTHAGYVQQDEETGRYECTLKIWSLGASVAERQDIRRLARRQMQRLAELTRETIHLAVLDGVAVLYIDKIDSTQAIRLHTGVGDRAPAYCVSTGKVLLAYAEEATVAAVSRKLVAHTRRTITDPEALRRALQAVRAAGYVINRGEYRDNVAGLGAPVFDRRGHPVAAIGVSGPADRLSQARLRALVPEVVGAANAVSEILGYELAAAHRPPERRPAHAASRS